MLNAKKMSTTKTDPIAVRTVRLNNLILGKGFCAMAAATTKIAASGTTMVKHSLAASESANIAPPCPSFTDIINREGLLDTLCVLYNECEKDVLMKRDRNVADFVNKMRPVMEETRRMRINVDDFQVKSLIGKGYFGTVHLVTERLTGDVYAMKCIKKPNSPSSQQLKEERDIMAQRRSEWITNLQYAFQDTEHLYLVMEFLPGGDFLGLMSRHSPFNDELIRFYLAELAEAINALHMMGYVHRDIKPENILIDRFGHLKLADFGNAAALNRNGHVLSMSPVGTPDYIAPELLQTIANYKLVASLHDVSCDFWSMGIIGYEMIYDSTPFYSKNVHETYTKILGHCENADDVEEILPSHDTSVSDDLRNLLNSLITHTDKRLNYEKIRNHLFFKTVNWNKLRQQVPPIIPNLNNEADTSHFEYAKSKETCKELEKPTQSIVKTNDFSGQHLPFIGYTYIHLADNQNNFTAHVMCEDARVNKLKTQVSELQNKLSLRANQVEKLKEKLLSTEKIARHYQVYDKLLAKSLEEIEKLKEDIKEKTLIIATHNTEMKTLGVKVNAEEETWEKRTADIRDLFRIKCNTYIKAQLASDSRYEELMAERKAETQNTLLIMDARANEIALKVEENKHLAAQVEHYKKLFDEQKATFQEIVRKSELEKCEMAKVYEQDVCAMRERLLAVENEKKEQDHEMRRVQQDLRSSLSTIKATEEFATAKECNYKDVLARLNNEVESNKVLRKQATKDVSEIGACKERIAELEKLLESAERDLKVDQCSRVLSKALDTMCSPFETAPGSLTDLTDECNVDTLRANLQEAQENDHKQKERVTYLEQLVNILEEMVKRMEAEGKSNVEDLLERQNEKLEDKLTAVREQLVIERQSARTANLNMWKLEKQLDELRAEKKIVQRRQELTEERVKRVQTEHEDTKQKFQQTLLDLDGKERHIRDLTEKIVSLKNAVAKEQRKFLRADEETVRTKAETVDCIMKMRMLDNDLLETQHSLQREIASNEELHIENTRLTTELIDEQVNNKREKEKMNEMLIKIRALQRSYDQIKQACHITDTQLTEVEDLLRIEQGRAKTAESAIEKLQQNLRNRNKEICELNIKCASVENQLVESRAQYNELAEDYRAKTDHFNLNMQDASRLVNEKKEVLKQVYEAQQAIEVLTQAAQMDQMMQENRCKELVILKEENSRVLTELFYAKEKVISLQKELEMAKDTISEQQADIEELHNEVTEKEQWYLQRDIKAETTITQQKKLIDYLQIKVEDLTLQIKKKKTFANRIFGTATNDKENISPGTVEKSITYRTLEAESQREKQQIKVLQQMLDKVNITRDKNVLNFSTVSTVASK